MLQFKNKRDESKLLPASYKYPIILIFAAIGFLTIPDLLLLPAHGIDNSWAVGLNLATARGMQFGKDIVFTFGPLGFMYTPLFCQFNTWLISAAFTLFVHLLFIYSIVTMMKKLSAGLTDYILMGITLIFALPVMSVDYKLLFCILILLYLSIAKPPSAGRLLMLCLFISFLMAAASLIKFTAMVIIASILLFMTVFYLYKKQIKPLCGILFVYIVSILVLLVITKQKITNFPAYLLNSYEISSGYVPAMNLTGPFRDVCIGLCVVGLLIFLLLYSIFKNKPLLKYFILIAAGFVFVSFKHGYVRHDDFHIRVFFANSLLTLSALHIAHKKQLNLPLRCLSLIFVFVLMVAVFERTGQSMIMPDAAGKFKMVGSALSLATDDAAGKARKLENAKNDLRDFYSLKDETLKYIDNMTTGILPTETSLAFAYDLNWSCCPVFQSYSAYTEKLDTLNSRYFENAGAPEVLIYVSGSIDMKHPLFDMPATFRNILRNYKPASIDGERFIVLRKTDTPNLSPEKNLMVLKADFREPIPVPKIKNGYVFARIYTDYNLLGKIVSTIYKPSYIYIDLLFQGELKAEYKFNLSTARNGIFLSQCVITLNDLFAVFNGKLENNLDAFVVDPRHPCLYNNKIRVEFFAIPQ